MFAENQRRSQMLSAHLRYPANMIEFPEFHCGNAEDDLPWLQGFNGGLF